MKFIIEAKQPEAAQESFALILGAVIFTPIIIGTVLETIDAIERKIRNQKEKKNPVILASKLLDDLENRKEVYYRYPMPYDKKKDGSPMWKLTEPEYAELFHLPTPTTVKQYNEKLLKVTTTFAGLTATSDFLKKLEATLKSEFGDKRVTVSASGHMEDEWLDDKQEEVHWPTSPWYTLKHGKTTNNTEFYDYIEQWHKKLAAQVEKIKQNINALFKKKPTDNKQEMQIRSEYLKIAYVVLSWLASSSDQFYRCAHQLTESSYIDTAD